MAATVNRLLRRGRRPPAQRRCAQPHQRGRRRAHQQPDRARRQSRAARAHPGADRRSSTSPPPRGGNMYVVYLKNAEAVRVAETLRAVLSGESAPAAVASPRRHRSPPRLRRSGSSRSPARRRPVAVAAQRGSARWAARAASIQADPATNALIITAPEAVYRNCARSIDKLDVRRAQVYVEALIVEVTADKAAEFGIQWQAAAATSARNATQGVRRHQLRRARHRHQHHRRRGQPRQRSAAASTSA